jgi:hypothetical protein
VERFGEFLKLEVVLRAGQTIAMREDVARELMGWLGIEGEDLLEEAYIGMLERLGGRLRSLAGIPGVGGQSTWPILSLPTSWWRKSMSLTSRSARSCYRESLRPASEAGAESAAVPASPPACIATPRRRLAKRPSPPCPTGWHPTSCLGW